MTTNFLKGTSTTAMRLWLQHNGRLTVRDLNKVVDPTLLNEVKRIKNNANARPGANKDKQITYEDLVTWNGAKPATINSNSEVIKQVNPTLKEYDGYRKFGQELRTVIVSGDYKEFREHSLCKCVFLADELTLHENLILSERTFPDPIWDYPDKSKFCLPKYQRKLVKRFPIYSYVRPTPNKYITAGWIKFRVLFFTQTTKIVRIEEIQSCFHRRKDMFRVRHLYQFDDLKTITIDHVSQILLTEFMREYINKGHYTFEVMKAGHPPGMPRFVYDTLPKKEGFTENVERNSWFLDLG